MVTLTDASVRQFAAHVAEQHHALAGATIAASAAMACALGESCARISLLHLASGAEQQAASRVVALLATSRDALHALADEDGAAITAFAALRDAGQELQGQDRLCQMPVEVSRLSADAALLLQDFRQLVQGVQDDLEMAITLLAGTAFAAALLLDSNLRIWPDPALLAKYEPELAALRAQIASTQPVASVR